MFYLNLSNNNLSQLIPPELGELTHLSILDLSHNYISGEIPPEFDQKFSESRDILDLSHDDLSGFLSEAMAELHFDISFNYLRRSISLC